MDTPRHLHAPWLQDNATGRSRCGFTSAERVLVGHTPAGELCGKIVLIDAGDTVIDFGTIAFIRQTEAIPRNETALYSLAATAYA
jgi:hypothetical protein